MLLKNISKRLITVNGAMVNSKRGKVYQVKPGNNAAVEVPDELCENAFVKGLIESGDLQALQSTVVVENEEREPTEYDDMSKADVTEVAKSLEIEVKSSWSKNKIIDEIVALES